MNSAARYTARVKMTHNERLPPPPPLGADVTVVFTAAVLLVLTGSVADVVIEAVAVRTPAAEVVALTVIVAGLAIARSPRLQVTRLAAPLQVPLVDDTAPNT